jgi:hypothetical protein
LGFWIIPGAGRRFRGRRRDRRAGRRGG